MTESASMSQTFDSKRQQQQQTTTPSDREITLTSDELTAILQSASARQSTAPKSSDTTTLQEAIETARELGIPEEHVMAAAEELRQKKAQGLRIKASTRRRRDDTIRFAAITLFVFAIVMFTAGWGAAQWVLIGMGIALFVKALRWFRAVSAEKSGQPLEPGIRPGECRVCGKPAFNSIATYCEDHRIRGGAIRRS